MVSLYILLGFAASGYAQTSASTHTPSPITLSSSTLTYSEIPQASYSAQSSYINSVCRPNIQAFNLAHQNSSLALSDDELKALHADSLAKARDSKFPCEVVDALQNEKQHVREGCDFPQLYNLGPEGRDFTDEEKKKVDCLCQDSLLHLKAACWNCYAVHGWGKYEVASEMMSLRTLADKVCDTDILDVEAYLRELGAGTVSAGDVAESKTDVSLYYTSPMMSGSETGAQATETASVTGLVTGENANGTDVAAGAGELKVGGGMVMVALGVMAAL